MTTPIGFIGLGLMGSAVAGRLLTQHPLIVWNRMPAAATALVEAGATVASTAAEVFATCQTVFVMVTDDHAVDDILETVGGPARYDPGADEHRDARLLRSPRGARRRGRRAVRRGAGVGVVAAGAQRGAHRDARR